METGVSTPQITILSRIQDSLQPEHEEILSATQMVVYIRFYQRATPLHCVYRDW